MWFLNVLLVVVTLLVLYAVVRVAVFHGIRAAFRDAPSDPRDGTSSDLIGVRDQTSRRRQGPMG